MTLYVNPAFVNYGHDLAMSADLIDIDAMGAETDGRTVLAQALVRRITTPRGGLIDDSNYGYDVRAFLNDDLDAHALAQMGAAIDGEFRKDERVLTSQTRVTLSDGGLTVTSLIQDLAGPFTLVASVSTVDGNIALLKAA